MICHGSFWLGLWGICFNHALHTDTLVYSNEKPAWPKAIISLWERKHLIKVTGTLLELSSGLDWDRVMVVGVTVCDTVIKCIYSRDLCCHSSVIYIFVWNRFFPTLLRAVWQGTNNTVRETRRKLVIIKLIGYTGNDGQCAKISFTVYEPSPVTLMVNMYRLHSSTVHLSSNREKWDTNKISDFCLIVFCLISQTPTNIYTACEEEGSK